MICNHVTMTHSNKKHTWQILFTKKAEKEFSKLDKDIQKQIFKAIIEKLKKDPNTHLKSLTGDKKDFYKFRVGNYRLICHKNIDKITILILKIGHRRDVYRD